MSHENARLRDLAHYTAPPVLHLVTSRVIADMGGAYAHSVMISAGSRDGVSKGQAVISDEGLVGRVAEAGYQASRVLLITDINSRVPVIVENSRDRAFLSGDNTNRPLLTFLTADAAVAPGDRSEEHTSELQSHHDLVCRLLLEKKNNNNNKNNQARLP